MDASVNLSESDLHLLTNVCLWLALGSPVAVSEADRDQLFLLAKTFNQSLSALDELREFYLP